MNASSLPLVSVILTTYQNAALLPRAVDSVLGQSYPNIELIVVDDNDPASPARRATEAVMARYPTARYLRHPANRNGAAARNTGIRAAQGRYLAFLDNDDLYLSDHIARCVEALERQPACGCVLCDVLKLRAGLCWALVPALSGDRQKALLLSETALGTGSNLFVSAAAARALGGFDESFARHQDVEFGLRLFARYPACSLEGVQVLKEMGGLSHGPGFGTLRQAKRQLWAKFRREIAGLTPEERRRFFAGQYGSLLYAACRGGAPEEIRWARTHLERLRPLCAKEKLLLALTRLRLLPLYEAVKWAVRACGSGRLRRRAARGLAEHDRRLLDAARTGRGG